MSKEKIKFLKENDDGYAWVKDVDDATHVVCPIDAFQSLLDDSKNVYKQVDPDMESGSITISKREYASLRNCIRIVRDRAIQQIDKATTDEYGYKLNYAKETTYRIDRKNYKVIEVASG